MKKVLVTLLVAGTLVGGATSSFAAATPKAKTPTMKSTPKPKTPTMKSTPKPMATK